MSTDIKSPYCKPELWGGIECTINRVGKNFRDQLECTGHYIRSGDIQEFARLGISKLRYPVLWEYHQPSVDCNIDWSWAEQQLNLIRENNICPIAGLIHHGSGPVYTNLSDKKFPELLAAYARAVAEKFPWIEYYTPVNEPLTTARFSGLYGLWYPHHKDEWSFLRMLVNQVKGVVLSMQAIRKINPCAKLVQTEDLSKIHASPSLTYQADFENERRWLTYDLLCGKVDKQHYFWTYLLDHGIEETELLFFIENACPPDIAGFNYYVTSERYLDEHIENYPCHMHGGNGRHSYVDTEAVRHFKSSGLKALLNEAWNRYRLPIAITECHLSCTREEQLRWFMDTWHTCCDLREQEIDIRAVTAWSLLGAYDWNSLLTCDRNHYESGVFDTRHDHLRPTALAKMLSSLSSEGKYSHPVLAEKGWWVPRTQHSISGKKMPPLLIIGKNGTLGHAFSRICESRSIPFVALSRNEADILQEDSVLKVIDEYRPWAIINATGYVRVDEAETNYDECLAVNATGPGILANHCREKGIHFMTFSSDLVFDGDKKTPYHEYDRVKPLNVYGTSKAEGERLVQSNNPDSLIIRTSAFFGPWDKYNFAYAVLDSLKRDQHFHMPGDVIVSPTYVPDLANAAMDLFIDEEKGIWHISNTGMLTWFDFGSAIAERAGYKSHKLMSRPLVEMGWRAKRPLYSALESERGIELPQLDDALDRYLNSIDNGWK
jgi:dTDP-4-dehydrorhamnose reductase